MKKIADLMELERSDGNALIMSVSSFESSDGKNPKFISIGLHGKKEDGTWTDLRKGCTVRLSEIDQLISSLERAREMVKDGRIDEMGLSHSSYAKVVDWGGPKMSCSETSISFDNDKQQVTDVYQQG